MTLQGSPAGVALPTTNIQEVLETLDQGRVPTPSPNALLNELGLDTNGLPTNTLLA